MPFKVAKIIQKPSLVYIILNIFLIISISSTFLSCNNELDITAPYKEKILVYGFLDPTSPQQYIKVNKMFLDGKIDPAIMAQNPDTIYPENVKVRLKHFDKLGVYKDEVMLQKMTLSNRNKGVFADSPNYVFFTNNPLRPGDRYDISVERDDQGVLCDSKTDCIGPPRVLFPVPNNSIKFLLKNNTFMQIRIVKGLGVTAMEAYMSFTYSEYKIGTGQKTTKTIRWNFLPYTTGVENPVFLRVLSSDLFFELLADNIKEDNTVNRVADEMKFEYFSCGKQLSDYISVSKPSIGIVQKSGTYSNVNNGSGIFASRQYTVIDNVLLNIETVNAIKSNKLTKDLGF